MRPRLGAFTAAFDAILEAGRAAPPKQRRTAKRIHDRRRAEHGFAGGYCTIVKDYVRERRRRREAFVPLARPPGHAHQVDFGEALAVIGGERRRAAQGSPLLPRPGLPPSDACFLRAYPALLGRAA